MFLWRNKKNTIWIPLLSGYLARFFRNIELDPVVQSIISLTNLLMTNPLTVVAKVFLNTLIFLQRLLTFFQQKISMYLPYFKTKILSSRELKTSLSFEQLGLDQYML